MPVYRPWTYANRQELRARDAKAFRNNAAVYEEEQQARRQPAEVNPLDRVRSGGSATPLGEARKKGGGLFGKVKDFGGDALDVGKDIGGGALKALDSAGNNTLRPLMGVVSGQTEAERKPILDAQGNPTGKFYRSAHDPNRQRIGLGPLGDIDVSSFKQAGKAFKDAATQNPLDTFREGKRAWQETQLDPEMSTAKKVVLAGATDPLTYIGPGVVKAGLRAAPAAIQASRGARVAAAALESPRMASVGGVAGAAGAAQMAENADLSPGWQTAATLAGGLAGGVAGGSGAARQALKGKGPLRGMGGSVVESTNPEYEMYIETLAKHGVEARIGSDGNLHVANRRQALRTATDMEYQGIAVLEGTKIKGGKGATQPFHYGSPEYEAWMEEKRLRREEASIAGKTARQEPRPGRLPDVDTDAIRLLDDAERIREVTHFGKVDPAKEKMRAHFPENSQLRKYAPLADEERRVLREAREASPNSTAGQEAGIVLAEDDAVRFVNDLIGPETNARGISVAADTEIELRGFTIGRTRLSKPEKAFRARVLAIADEVYTQGHDATEIREPVAVRAGGGDIRPGPAEPVVAGVPEVEGAGGTVKRVDLEGNVTDTGRTEAEINRPVQMDEPATAAAPKARATQQSFDGSVQELPFDATPPNPAEVRPTATEPPPTGVTHRTTVEIRADIKAAIARGDDAAADALAEEYSAASRASGTKTFTQVAEESAASRAAYKARLEAMDAPAFEQEMRTVNDPNASLGDRPVEAAHMAADEARARASGTGVTRVTRVTRVTPEAPGNQATTGRNPEEPPRMPVPGGDTKPVSQMRAESPRGYVLDAPEGDPAYRRTQTRESMETQDAKPTPAPLVDRPKFSGDIEQIVDDWGQSVEGYHPNLAQPHDRLSQDYAALKRAAHARLRSVFLKDTLEQMGVDASDFKNLDPEMKRELRHKANAQAKATLKDVEDDVLRDGFWEPTRPSMGDGVPEGRNTGGVGSAPGQGDMIPPRQPGQPGTPSGKPQAPLGQEGPGVDLIDGVDRADLVARETKFLATKGGKLEQGIRKLLARIGFDNLAPNLIRDPRFTPIWQEMNRITNMRQSAKATVESMWRTAERSGLKLEQQADGNWLVAGTNQHLGDVIEQATPEAKAVWDSFSPETRDALTDMTTLMDEARQTVEHHGGDMPLIDVDGAYFPRKVAAIAGQAANEGAIGGRRLGARQGFQKARTEADMVNAAASDQITYAHPLDAFEAGFDAKLRAAQDAYIGNLLKPLVVPNAKAGFGGLTEIPNVGVMNEADATRAAAGLASHTPGTVEKVMGGINRALTPIRASYDASGLFQQGMRRWLTDPKGAAKDWRVAVRSLKDPEVYDLAVKEYDEAGPGLMYLARRGVRITAEGEANEVTRLTTTGATRAAGGIKKAAQTGQRISSELYDRPLNLHRLAAANAMYKRLQAKGLTGAALDAEMDAGAKAINRMYGWTGTRPSSIESAALFAPRYFRANIETIVKAASDGGIEGSEARKHLALLAGEGAALVVTINAARGHETEFDPRSSNFMRIRDVGGLDVSPYGGYDILMRAIAGTIGGDDKGGIDPDVARLGRLAWGKASPAMKLVIEPLKGETYMGKKIDPLGNPGGFAWEQFKSSVPFGAQNLIEGVEQGEPGNAVKGTLVGSLGVSQQPMTPAERRDFARDAAAKEKFGKSYADLPGGEKAQVNESTGVSKWQQQADKRAKNGSGSDYERSTKIRETATKKLDALSAGLEAGQMTGDEWRKQYQTIQAELRGGRDVLKIDGKKDAVLEGWFGLYDRAEGEDGRINYDLLDSLQAEYRAKNPGIDEKVDRVVGAHDNATVREYREASELAQEYYSIPAYRGLSAEDSEKASRILMAASDLVSFGKARDKAAALRMLRQVDAEGVRLAQTASRRGTNPARAKWRKDPAHALYAKFYGSFTAASDPQPQPVGQTQP